MKVGETQREILKREDVACSLFSMFDLRPQQVDMARTAEVEHVLQCFRAMEKEFRHSKDSVRLS
eukprot:scaffold373193_cov42-Prasinocladus_malaysianus.AAC.1